MFETTKTKKGYNVETQAVEIEIRNGRITAGLLGGAPFRELNGKQFANDEEALRFVEDWYKKNTTSRKQDSIIF